MIIISVFWTYVILFIVIGAVRGWPRELLVCFSAILALSLNFVIRRYVPIASVLPENDLNLFWIRTIILMVLVYFGYQTVVSIPHLASLARRERLQDALFGAFLGGFNGYLITGTILYYMHVASYPFQDVFAMPANPNILQVLNQMMLYMPPQVLGEPGIYFAMILMYVFVLYVYVPKRVSA